MEWISTSRKLLLAMVFVYPIAVALAAEPETPQEQMQKALNQQVMASPFDPGDVQKAQVYAEQAKAEGVIPVAQAPTYWAPGWTCANLTAYRYYYYNDYRNCVYYHYYYGRYWR